MNILVRKKYRHGLKTWSLSKNRLAGDFWLPRPAVSRSLSLEHGFFEEGPTALRPGGPLILWAKGIKRVFFREMNDGLFGMLWLWQYFYVERLYLFFFLGKNDMMYCA